MECDILPGGRGPTLGTIKDCFPSVCDAFQLPDLLLGSLFNTSVGYMHGLVGVSAVLG